MDFIGFPYSGALPVIICILFESTENRFVSLGNWEWKFLHLPYESMHSAFQLSCVLGADMSSS